MASTLSLGSSSYQLLEELGATGQLTVKTTGSTTQVRATGGPIESLGIDTSSLPVSPTFDNWVSSGTISGTQKSSNISVFGGVNNFGANLGSLGDTLSVFGDIAGSSIFLDEAKDSYESQYSSTTNPDGNDLLNISGSISAGSEIQENIIYAGGGNDTIRITGSIEDSYIFLGDGNDYFSAGSSNNVDVKGDDGNDYIQFRKLASDTRVNTGSGFDTVTLSGLEGSYNDGVAAVELGANNDSLSLGSGNYFNANFNTGSGIDSIVIAGNSYFDNTSFHLDGFLENNNVSGGDRITSEQGNFFYASTFTSNNSNGDTLVFGSTTAFESSTITFGSGNDSLVFGSNSILNDSFIRMGGQSDTLVFGASTSFNNTVIDLGGDTFMDYIRFNNTTGDSLTGISITGANDGDYLYIGATGYSYSSTGSQNDVTAGFYNSGTRFQFNA